LAFANLRLAPDIFHKEHDAGAGDWSAIFIHQLAADGPALLVLRRGLCRRGGVVDVDRDVPLDLEKDWKCGGVDLVAGGKSVTFLKGMERIEG
jgi:hypothetical protein